MRYECLYCGLDDVEGECVGLSSGVVCDGCKPFFREYHHLSLTQDQVLFLASLTSVEHERGLRLIQDREQQRCIALTPTEASIRLLAALIQHDLENIINSAGNVDGKSV